MKYMLLCYDDEQAWEQKGQAALEAAMQEAISLTHELHAKGQYLEASPLEPATADGGGERSRSRRQGAYHERAIRRNARGAGRLLSYRRREPRRSDSHR
jgi:hypothetical protein